MSIADTADRLDAAEKSRLSRLERTVERAVDAAGKIAGEALATIRDERLYRATHWSFEDYVRDRFGFSRSTADRMIAAASGGTSIASLKPAEDEGPVQSDAARGKVDRWRGWGTLHRTRTGRLSVVLDEPDVDLPDGARIEVLWTQS